MSKTRVPCCLVTSMDRHSTDALLQRLGMRQYFTCMVTGERPQGRVRTSLQRKLAAAPRWLAVRGGCRLTSCPAWQAGSSRPLHCIWAGPRARKRTWAALPHAVC